MDNSENEPPHWIISWKLQKGMKWLIYIYILSEIWEKEKGILGMGVVMVASYLIPYPY